VYRDIDLVVGQVVTVRVAGEDFTLFRTASGPQMVQGRCPHRGTALGVGRVEGDTLVCAHHGWCWRGDGSPGPAHGAQSPARARSFVLRVELGLVFAWLGEGDAGPFMEVPAGPWTAMPTNRWPCSYGRRLENSVDLAHVPHSHRTSGVGAGFAPDLGGTGSLIPGGLEVRSGQVPPVRFYPPNVLQFRSPAGETWADHLVWRVPEDVESCRSFVVARAEVPCSPQRRPFQPTRVERLGEEVLQGEQTLADLASEPSLTEIEDYVVLVGQGSLAGQPPEALGVADEPVRALRRVFCAALNAPLQPLRIEALP
jgi:5,5'-dehydrodivanillate O-demethylase oxygenase subunit